MRQHIGSVVSLTQSLKYSLDTDTSFFSGVNAANSQGLNYAGKSFWKFPP